MVQRRYPGVRPFEANERELFFGREREVQDLDVLITLQKIVVLFGKSGYGKSSLINAGLIPKLKLELKSDDQPLIPIVVRFGNYIPGVSLSPIDTLISKVNETVPVTSSGDFLNTIFSNNNLWYQFKRRQSILYKRFLLVFDQFEEFFSYPASQQEVFSAQLSDLLFVNAPQSVRQLYPSLDREHRRFLADNLEVKALFAIRSDRINLLHGLGSFLPSILDKKSRFELKALTAKQAVDAVRSPATKGGYFESPSFEFSEEALEKIVEKLSEKKWDADNKEIEAFQLQILCEFLEGEVIAGRIPKNRIMAQHFENKIDAIYEGYYQRLLDRLNPNIVEAAQKLIEESLIFEDDQTGESRRLSVDADVLVQRFSSSGISHGALSQLESAFLLRREANSFGGFSYEVSHDTLLGAILAKKKERRDKEARELAIAKEQQRRANERKQRKRLIGAISLAILGFGLAAFAGAKSVEAGIQRKKAEEAKNAAIEAQKRAEESLIALQNEQKRSRAIEYENFGDSYFSLGKFQEALDNYNRAKELTPDNTELDEKIESCMLMIKK